MAGQGATSEWIFAIIVEVTAALSRAKVTAIATTQYVQNPYKVDINPGTLMG